MDLFNPEGIIGFGIEGLNRGAGIEDTPENRQALFDILQGAKERGVFDVRQIDFGGFLTADCDPTIFQETGRCVSTRQFSEITFPTIPEAFADETPISRTISDETISKQEPTPQGTTSIEGIVRSELETEQEFKVFSADSSQSVIGVIREIVQDPTQLQVDSFGNPIETASERASRVFEETGQFAGESFDIISEAEKRASEFDFGTNLGEALKIPTGTPETESLSLAEQKRIEEEKSLLVFDSRSISNF